MVGVAQPVPPEPQRPSAADRLDSWKEIAAYLKRSVRTVHRWEAEQELPVHRHLHQSSGTVYAFKSELDAWWASRRVELESIAESGEVTPAVAPQSQPHLLHRWLVAAAAVVLIAVVVAATR